MKTIKVTGRLTTEEKETILHYDYVDKVWTMDSSVTKHFNKAIKQGWTPVTQYVYEDGTVCGMILTAPAHAVTIRNPNKKRVMNEAQMRNLQKHDNDEEEEDED